MEGSSVSAPPRGASPEHDLSPISPEARRRAAQRWLKDIDAFQDALGARLQQPTRRFTILRRVALGVWNDGFIHAGNLAYMTILALFPFFIVVGAALSLVGEADERAASVRAFLTALPPVVAKVLEPVAQDVITARHGWLLWAGSLVGVWTVSSLVETIRDILRRAYGTPRGGTFWHYRLLAGGITMLAVVLLMASLFLQLAIGTVQQMLVERVWVIERFAAHLPVSLPAVPLVPMAVLFGAIYLLFILLAPAEYRRAYPTWPGAALVTGWWGVVSLSLPVLLRVVFKYDLTYGSLAGTVICLFFFWLVGLGIVTGAELNAALAVTPEERDLLDQAGGQRAVGSQEHKAGNN